MPCIKERRRTWTESGLFFGGAILGLILWFWWSWRLMNVRDEANYEGRQQILFHDHQSKKQIDVKSTIIPPSFTKMY